MPRKIKGVVVYDTKEASKELRRAPRTIQKWCREGKLKAGKMGHEYLIPETALADFVKEIFDGSRS